VEPSTHRRCSTGYGGESHRTQGGARPFKRRRIREEAAHLYLPAGLRERDHRRHRRAPEGHQALHLQLLQKQGRHTFGYSRLGITLALDSLQECLATSGTHWDRLKLIVDHVTRLILDNEESIVVYLREEKNLEESAAREIRELRSLFDHRLATLLENGSASGEFTIDNAGLTATTISGMMSWVALWYSPGVTGPSPRSSPR
jgi:hypothetical protein